MRNWPRWLSLGCLVVSIALASGCGGRESGPAPEPYTPEETESGEFGAVPKEFQGEADIP